MGIVLIFIGVATAIVILELIGKPGAEGKGASSLRQAHHILSYLFLLVFLLIFIVMSTRLRFWPGDLEARVVFHWILADIVLAVIIAKIIINRRYKKMYNHLPVMGWTILLCTFVLIMLTGGYDYVKHSGPMGSRAQADYSYGLVQHKCSRCHSLVRLEALKDPNVDVGKTVERMRTLSVGWVTADEEGYITDYLLQQKK